MPSQYVKIIPAVKLPKSLGFFDYKLSPELENKIKVGQILEIPWRHKLIPGAVLEMMEKTDFSEKDIKSISRIISEKPLLTASQLKLIQWMSDYYFQSPALILKAMMPPILKRPRKAKDQKKIKVTDGCEISEEDGKNVVTITDSVDNFLLIGKINFVFYLKLIKYYLKRDKQVLILVPEINRLNQLIGFFNDKIEPEKLAILSGEVSRSAYYQSWQKILANEAKLILGTRMAIFAPLVAPGLIIIDSEANSSFKQWDQNPRYQAVDVAWELAKLSGAKLILSDISPSLESYFKFDQGLLKKIKMPEAKLQIAFELIDMRDENKKRNYSFISEVLHKELDNLSAGKQAIIFINRKGSSAFTVCGDCGYIPRCPKCNLPFSYYQINKFNDFDLACHSCQTKDNLPPFCPHCHGSRFRYPGLGTAGAEAELKKKFPKLKIKRLDSDVPKTQADEIISGFKNKDVDVLICTQVFFNYSEILKVDLMAIVSADIILNLPDYQAAEKTWQLLTKLIDYSSRLVIIQTFNPENFVFKNIITRDFEKFYQTELSNRKEFNYPPFGKIIRLTVQDFYQKSSESFADKIYQIIQEYIKKNSLNVEALGPIKSAGLVRNRFRYHIILRYFDQSIDIRPIINLVPDNWLIDVNSESLA